MNLEEQQYLDILSDLLYKGVYKGDRTGTGTNTLFCRSMRFDLSKSFPLLTTKKVFMKGIIAELLWFLSGSQNERELCELTHGTNDLDKKTIWTDNCADRAKLDPNRFNGYNMGNMYNVAWRKLPCEPHGVQKVKRKEFVETDSIDICAGAVSTSSDTERALYSIWEELMSNSYTKLCNRWKTFNLFVYDCYFLDGFQEFVDSKYTKVLDINYYGSGVYSPKTAIFIDKHLSKELELSQDIDEDNMLTRPIIYIDQIQNMIDLIKKDPDSRRIIVDAWNPRVTENGVLGICHPLFQVQVLNGKINLVFMMRSSDTFLGLPYNIASYAILVHLLAHHTGYEVGELVYEGHDVHLYSNHFEQAKEQLSREAYPFPQLEINWKDSIYDYSIDDFKLIDYVSHPSIKAPMAV